MVLQSNSSCIKSVGRRFKSRRCQLFWKQQMKRLDVTVVRNRTDRISMLQALKYGSRGWRGNKAPQHIWTCMHSHSNVTVECISSYKLVNNQRLAYFQNQSPPQSYKAGLHQVWNTSPLTCTQHRKQFWKKADE